MSGIFNTDTNALKTRAELNAAKGKHDLEEWILQQIPSLSGLRILDLGCGTGKQLFRFSPLVGPAGSLVGIDLSMDAVRAVNDRARAEGLGFVEARQMSLDDCVRLLAGERFDLVLSSYAIYYASNQVALLRGLRSVVKDRGTVFVCGPGRGTNREVVDLVNRFVADEKEKLPPAGDFLLPAQIQDVARAYSRFTLSRLENEIVFDSAETVLDWWQRHNTFRPSVAPQVRQQLSTHFQSNRTFTLTKNVLGVRYDV